MKLMVRQHAEKMRLQEQQLEEARVFSRSVVSIAEVRLCNSLLLFNVMCRGKLTETPI